MRKISLRVLLAGLLLVLLAIGGGAWLLGSRYGRALVAQRVRQQLAKNSDLVLGPFEVEFSPWRDFPHLTASLRHLALTDTARGRAESVLRLDRADARLELGALLHGRVQVTRLTLSDGALREVVDSAGHSWGLRGKRRPGPGKAPALDIGLDSLIINNFSIATRNDFIHSAIGARVRVGRLAGRLAGGVLRVQGLLDGQLEFLQNPSGTLLAHEPVQARVRYHYTFRARQGSFDDTRFTLNGDTVRLSGTHTVDPRTPTGTQLDLRFAGDQPLLAVLNTALPPRLRPYLAGAVSPSKAQVTYHIEGQSGPTVRPRTLLTFGLRDASLAWPDSARRINHWDLAATYDNGPGHRPETTTLTLQRCRLYSPAGQLDVGLVLRNFRRPYVEGRLSGRTELPELAALLTPRGLWRARRGTAALNVTFRGLLRPPPNRTRLAALQRNLDVRGTVVLRNAELLLPARHARLADLNVRIGIADSLWQLSNASGVLDGMRFRASATTVHLLGYLTGQSATTTIRGDFAVDDLNVGRLRGLLRPPAGALALPNARRRAQARAALTATLGTSLIPKGMRLSVALHCRRLLLPADTLSNLFVRVYHDGHHVRLQGLTGRIYGGEVQGNLAWPTDTAATDVAPISFQLAIHFGTLPYQQLLARLAPVPRPALGHPGYRKRAALPALRELLLAADGQLDCSIDAVRLPDGQFLRNLRLRLIKEDSLLDMPYLTVTVPQGGQGRASASAIVDGLHLTAAAADVSLRYATLDVQQLLKMLAALNPPDSLVTPARRVARQAARTRRATARTARGRPRSSMLANGVLAATLHVQAGQVRYAAVRGGQFRLAAHLTGGAARLDTVALNAFGGRMRLSGVLQTNRGRDHHPLHVQTTLDDIQLSEFFSVAQAMHLRVLGGDNIRGTVRLAGDLRTDLDATFLPGLDQTQAYLQADIRNLELIDVEALTEGLRFIRKERSGHLYFEPVRTQLVLDRGEVLIPGLELNSNLANMAVNGTYAFDGRANLYVGANAIQALFGDNRKRIERIKNHQPLAARAHPGLTYVNLRRATGEAKYHVRLFKKDEQRQQQDQLRLQARQFLVTQRLDTTLHLLP
ncbi:MAG: AsmA-like C-terminal region-containing protein [Janthinobacterium lividum]